MSEETISEEAFMDAMWLGFIQWAWGNSEMREAFTAETGLAIPGPRSGIEAIVDKACGHDPMKDVLDVFVEWATRTHWGIESAPVKYRESLGIKS